MSQKLIFYWSQGPLKWNPNPLSNQILLSWIISLLNAIINSAGAKSDTSGVFPRMYFLLHARQNKSERNNKRRKLFPWTFIVVSLYQVPKETPTSTEAITSRRSLLVCCDAILEDDKVNLSDDENQHKYPHRLCHHKWNAFILYV